MYNRPWKPSPVGGAQSVIQLDAPVTTVVNSVHGYVGAPSDPTSTQCMRLVELSGTLDFWDDPQEDIYSPEDGDPL